MVIMIVFWMFLNFYIFVQLIFIVKHMKKFDSKFTSICLLPNMCIKCYSFHELEKNLNNF